MLDYSIMKPEGILVLKPNAPLSKEDFDGLSAYVDSYLSDHAKLRGVMVHTSGFPGWESFSGFAAHLHFISEHHKKVERVAIVTDSQIADMVEPLGNHFTLTEIRHYPFSDDVKALEWLETASDNQEVIRNKLIFRGCDHDGSHTESS